MFGADGVLEAVERITTDMPSGRHGIYRFWDVVDAGDANARLVPEDIVVSQDGRPATVEMSWQDQRRYRVARIGDADVTLSPGRHVYEIRYRIEGAIAGTDDGAELYWDVVARGWQMPILRSEVRVALPGGSRRGHLYDGQRGVLPGRHVPRRDRGAHRALEPRTGVTVRGAARPAGPGPGVAALDREVRRGPRPQHGPRAAARAARRDRPRVRLDAGPAVPGAASGQPGALRPAAGRRAGAGGLHHHRAGPGRGAPGNAAPPGRAGPDPAQAARQRRLGRRGPRHARRSGPRPTR